MAPYDKPCCSANTKWASMFPYIAYKAIEGKKVECGILPESMNEHVIGESSIIFLREIFCKSNQV